MTQNQVPITRLGKFFGQEDFDLDINMGREWLDGDMNFTIVVYRVNKQKTNQDDVYGEALPQSIEFLPPISVNAYLQILQPDNSFLGNSKILQNEPGNIKFAIYQKDLEDLQISISLGDYIGYWITENQVRYYSVVDKGIPNYDNKHTYGGYKPFYVSFIATPVTANEFMGI